MDERVPYEQSPGVTSTARLELRAGDLAEGTDENTGDTVTLRCDGHLWVQDQ